MWVLLLSLIHIFPENVFREERFMRYPYRKEDFKAKCLESVSYTHLDVYKRQGYDIANVIYNIEIKGYNSNNKKNIVSGYNILLNNKDNKEFHSIIVRLKNTLNHDESIRIISQDIGKSRSDIVKLFDEIEMR